MGGEIIKKIKNIGLVRCEKSTVQTFTTDFGIKFRRVINKPLRFILFKSAKRKIVVESYPDLPAGKTYIFASTHSFDEDILCNLAVADRSTYLLSGSTEQLEYNRQNYAAWVNGMIFVDRLNAKSRSECLGKMERILRAGSSVLIFPEGGWNDTENLLIHRLFAGVHTLSAKTQTAVVPVSVFHEVGANTMYYRAGEPLNLFEYEKAEALRQLRDTMATMMFEQIEKHSTPLKRAELTGDIHLDYMKTRKDEYMRVKWTRDMWNEELTVYKDKANPLPAQIREFADNVRITCTNAGILAPELAERELDKLYDFKAYMHRTWRNA